MRKLAHIRCVILNDGKKEEVFVKYKYPATSALTIREIKAAASSHLRTTGGVAKLEDSDGEELTLDDGEPYMVDDGIWVEFDGNVPISPLSSYDSVTISPTDDAAAISLDSNYNNDFTTTFTANTSFSEHTTDRLSMPTDSDSTVDVSEADRSPADHNTYIFEKDGKTYKFITNNEYKTWAAMNKTTTASVYETLKPKEEIFIKKVPVYDFFNCDSFRGSVVLSTYPAAGGRNIPLCNQAQEVLFKGTIQLIAKAYASEDLPYSELSASTKLLSDWLKLPFILEWSSNNSASRLGKAFRNRKWRSRKSDGTIPTTASKKRKIGSSFGTFDLQQLKKVSNEIKSSADHSALEESYKKSCLLRCQWYEQLNADPNYKRGIAAEVISKFPSIKTNLNFLHYDYVCYMTAKYGRVPDIGMVLTNNAKSFLAVAKEYKICFSTTNDLTFDALCILPQLLQQFSSNVKKCTLSRLLLTSETHDSASLLLQKLQITTAPMLLLIQKDSIRTYFVATDDSALQLPYCNAARALQSLFELHYIFNLEYDKNMALLFELLEWLEGFNRKQKTLFLKISEALRLIAETDARSLFTEETSTDIHEKDSTATNEKVASIEDETHLINLLNASTPTTSRKTSRISDASPKTPSMINPRKNLRTPTYRDDNYAATPSSSRSTRN